MVSGFDDELKTFRILIARIFRSFPGERSDSLALHTHTHGQGIVWSGSKEFAELKRDQIRSAGPHCHAEKKVGFPLGVRIEALPG